LHQKKPTIEAPDLKSAKVKAAAWCAYQERAPLEARQKLIGMGLEEAAVEQAIDWLVQEGFVHEERFARAFVGGKFRLKQWGREKIRYGLRTKGITGLVIEKALEEIDPAEYLETAKALYQKKSREWAGTPTERQKQKLYNFLVNKGYESILVIDLLAAKVSLDDTRM